MPARRTTRSLRALVVAAALATPLVAPADASAEPDLPWFDEVASSSVNVSGSYTPVVGNFTDLELDDIVWYAPGSAADQWWAPCPGCGGGPFTKKALVPQVSGRYEPVVGDFAGDGHDDIYWRAEQGGADHLWTSNGSAGFTSKRLDVADRYERPIVLPDGADGVGKDAILWQGPPSPGYPDGEGRLWELAGDGSGRVVRSTLRVLPPSSTANPVVGDFDGSGAADIFWYGRRLGPCIPRCTPPAEITDVLWSRTPGGFDATTVSSSLQVAGWFRPVAGQLGASEDGLVDVLWIGSSNQGSYYPTDGPDRIWDGRAATGTFGRRDTSIPFPATGQVLHHAGPDLVLLDEFPAAEHSLWFDTGSGPVLREVESSTSALLRSSTVIVGRFTDPDADAILTYAPGAGREHLLAQIF